MLRGPYNNSIGNKLLHFPLEFFGKKIQGRGSRFGAPKGGLERSDRPKRAWFENARKNREFFDFFLQNFPEVLNFFKKTIKIGAALRAARNFF